MKAMMSAAMPPTESGGSPYRSAHAPIVHKHHGTIMSQPVGVDGIRVVHWAGEMLKANHRRRALFPNRR